LKEDKNMPAKENVGQEILVPELGESVLEATVSRWLKQEGERVRAGEVLVELETDKVNLEVGAKSDGVLKKIERQENEDVQVGDILGIIGQVKESLKRSLLKRLQAMLEMATAGNRMSRSIKSPREGKNTR
jgi:pyruvate/2-oxoglutarate dehydrogenase complex dihydrolipoamide acyltransferase (E2) component